MVLKIYSVNKHAQRSLLDNFVVLHKIGEIEAMSQQNLMGADLEKSSRRSKSFHLNLNNHFFDDFSWSLHSCKPLDDQVGHKTLNSA